MTRKVPRRHREVGQATDPVCGGPAYIVRGNPNFLTCRRCNVTWARDRRVPPETFP